MAIQVTQSVPALSDGAVIPLSIDSDNFKVSFIITPAAATTVTVYVTLETFARGNTPSRWYPLDDFTSLALTAPQAGNIFFPVTGIYIENSGAASLFFDLVQGAAR